MSDTVACTSIGASMSSTAQKAPADLSACVTVTTTFADIPKLPETASRLIVLGKLPLRQRRHWLPSKLAKKSAMRFRRPRKRGSP